MASDAGEEVQNALLAIHARLGTIEGKINLVARAEREQVLKVLQEAIADSPLLGQIYLLLDGERTQKAIHGLLQERGINTSQPTVSRRMDDLVTEYGLADPIARGGVLVLRRNRAAEDVLNLSKRVKKWLEDAGETLPEEPVRRRKS